MNIRTILTQMSCTLFIYLFSAWIDHSVQIKLQGDPKDYYISLMFLLTLKCFPYQIDIVK